MTDRDRQRQTDRQTGLVHHEVFMCRIFVQTVYKLTSLLYFAIVVKRFNRMGVAREFIRCVFPEPHKVRAELVDMRARVLLAKRVKYCVFTQSDLRPLRGFLRLCLGALLLF